MSSVLDDQALLVNLLLQDIETEQDSHKGKRRYDDAVPDCELVWELQKLELQSIAVLLEDRRMALSIARAQLSDQEILGQIAAQDEFERGDRAAAVAYSRGDALPVNGIPRPPSVASQAPPVTDLIHHLSLDDDTDSESESTTRGASSSTDECIICGDRIRGRKVKMPCNHIYDTRCAARLFNASLTDETLFPPRCCRLEIPLATVSFVFRPEFVRRFEHKFVEHNTKNKLYCAKKDCSNFLGAGTSDEDPKRSVTCSECRTVTCSSCKGTDHPFFVPCQTDEPSAALLELGAKKGWQRCPQCHRMVELSQGCHHMICLCRAEFCYLCAAKWKTCDCIQWEEDRLLQAAEHQVHVQHADHPINPIQMRREVRQRMEDLRIDHECQHTNWRLRQGAARCENCHNRLDRYILCCTQCQMLACVRCQRNRL